MQWHRVRFLVTIHDVIPDVLDRVAVLLDLFLVQGRGPVTLLVVPGSFNERESIDRLRALLQQDVLLAGHGWNHRAVAERDLYHRLHSSLISRNAAEHLSRSEQEVCAIVNSCGNWFVSHGFCQPELYVPPAWAMGRLTKKSIKSLPFSMYEFQTGMYNGDRHIPLPLLGFEADTPVRKFFLQCWNQMNRYWAMRRGILRVAVHPYDLELGLAEDVRRIAAKAVNRIGCHQLRTLHRGC